MSNAIATVKSMDGIFFSKDTAGNITQLKVGDIITGKMLVYGDNSNSALSHIEISMNHNDNIIELVGTQEQLFDDSTYSDNTIDAQEGMKEESIATAISDDDDYRDELLEELSLEEEQEEPDETEAGEEEQVKGESESAEFDARDGNLVDVNSDLRDAKFNSSNQLFEEEKAKGESEKGNFDARDGNLVDVNSDLRDAEFETPTDSILQPIAPEDITPIIPEISINDVTINELNGTITFTVTSTALIGSDITFSYNSADITATSGTDFTAVSGTGVIPSGQTTTTIVVPIIDDFYTENSETFSINLSNVSSNALLANGKGIGTILDNGASVNEPNNPNSPDTANGYDAEDTVFVKLDTNSAVNEGENLTHIIKLVDENGNDVLLQSGQSVDVTLNYSFDSADLSDFTAQTTITITGSATGNSSATIINPTFDDTITENNEEYTLSINSITDNNNTFENIVDEGSIVRGTILDNDTSVISITATDNNAVEGTTNNTISFLVSQSNESNFDTDVVVTLNLGSVEAADVDSVVTYTDAAGNAATTTITALQAGLTITIPANSTYTPEFVITAVDDAIFENSESLSMSVALASTETDATISAIQNIARGIIYDEGAAGVEDTAVVSLIGPSDVTEGETTAAYTISVDQLASDVNSDITVTFTYTGVAVDGTDFTGVASQVIAAGTNATTFTLATIDDALAEGVESFNIAINTITDTNFEAIAEHATNNSVTTTITDQIGSDTPAGVEDTVYIELTQNATNYEGNDLTHTVTLVDASGVAITPEAGTSITVNLEYIASLDETELADFTTKTLQVTIGESGTATITNETINDLLIEGSESYTLKLSTIVDNNSTYEKVEAISDTVTGIIYDDVDPNPDTATVQEGLNTITGNLLTNDEIGYNSKVTSFKYLDESGNEQTGTLGTEVNTQYGKITLNENGTWSFTSDQTEDHSGMTDLIDTITYTVADGTTSADSTLKITITDDVPTVDVNVTSVTEPTLQVDETDLTNATANFSANFVDTTLDAGEDGQATLTKVYTLGTTGGDSGLVDSLTNESIILSLNGTIVEGRTETSDDLVFTLSIDSSTGVVTLHQDRAIEHSDTTNSNDVSTTITDNLITLTKTDTLTDNDGDVASDSASINIGSNISFLDDGPSVNVSTTGTEAALQVDETDLTSNATVNFSGSFTDTVDAGEDGQATLSEVYTLSAAESGYTGLTDTLTNEVIISSLNASGVVEGRTASSNLLVFSVSVGASSGEVTLNQERAIVHSDTTNPDDVSTTITDSLIKLTKTTTLVDNDGDIASDSATINIGSNISFKDDAPTAVNDANVNVVEGASAINGNVITNDTVGADDATVNSFTYTDINEDTQTVTFSDTNPQTVTTKDGSLIVNPNGNYSFTPNGSIDHDDTGTLGSFDYTLIDGDGDISNSATQTITVTDTNPSATAIDASVNENDLVTGSTPTPADLIVVKSLGISKDQDNIADVTFAASTIASLEALGLKSNGIDIDYALTDTHTITATAGGSNIFTVVLINPTDITGLNQSYTFTLIGTIDHPTADSTNSVDLEFTFDVTDIDSTVNNNTFKVSVIDDIPTAVADTNTIEEGADILSATTVNGDVINASVVTSIGDAADTTGADANLSVVGVVAGTTITNSTSGAVTDVRGTYGSVNIAADGTYTYTLDNENLDVQHLVLAETLTDTFVYTIKDQDGDMSSQTLSVTITATDDGVTVTSPEDYTGTDNLNTDQVVYESGLTTGSSTNVTNTQVDSSFTIKALDGLDHVDFTIGATTTTFTVAQIEALSTTSQSVTTEYGTLVLDGYTQATDGVITLDYVYTLTSAPDVTGTDTMDNILITATDRGGLLTTGSDTLSIKIIDDAPTAVTNTINVQEDAADQSGNDDTNTATSIVAGNVITNDIQGADSVTVTGVKTGSDTLTDATTNVSTGVAGTYGTVNIASDGTYTYTLDNTKAIVQELAEGETKTDIFTYTITDNDGDTSSTTLTVTVNGTNDAPVISVETGDSAAESITETNTTLTTSGTLSIFDVDTTDTVVATKVDSITTGGTYSGTLPTDAELKAMLTVSGGDASTTEQSNVNGIAWTFTSGSEYFDAIPAGETLTLTYEVLATDTQGATDTQTVTITITGTNDSGIIISDNVATNEDTTYNGNIFANDTVDPDFNEPLSVSTYTLDINGDGTATTQTLGVATTIKTDSSGTIGEFTLNSNGSYTFVPFNNYSGAVPVVTYTAGNSTFSNSDTLTITVNPISDAPGVAADYATLNTSEDTVVALGFNAPTVTDTTDQNGTGAATGDNPELLSFITLTGIPAGAVLNYGASAYTSDGNPIIIKLDDVSNLITHTETSTLTMSKSDFEAMTVLPVSQSGTNFTVTMSVTEYEVDDAGMPIVGVDGATSSTEVEVDVLAVTDTPISSIDGAESKSYTFNEDTTLDLTTDLVDTFVDIDGSEKYSYSVSGLAEGTELVIGTTTYIADASGTITSNQTTIDAITEDPTFTITPPKNFSGDMSSVTITLNTIDSDSDSTVTPITESDSITLSLRVNPIADDIADMSVKTTNEDTAVLFLNDLDLTDKDTDGTESITKVVLTGLDEGTVILYNGVSTTIDSSGTFIIGDGSSILDITNIQAATITPPAHSSSDMSITVGATVQDVNGSDTDTDDSVQTFALVVKPIAESTQTNTAGDSANDIITQGDHTYTTAVNEDEYVDLNVTETGFTGLSLANEDSAETTSVLFTPKDADGDLLTGTIFMYGTTKLIFNGTAVEIPSSELTNLQVKAPAQYSGTMILTTKVKSIDYDDDSSGKEASNTVLSEGDTLTITVNPIADNVTVAIKQSFGVEDAGRDDSGVSGIALKIAVTSADKDGSETYTLKLSDIPDGAEIYYNGELVTPSSGTITQGSADTAGQFSGANFQLTSIDSNATDGTWELEIQNFDKSKLFTYIPEDNSNENITLKVQAQSVDGSDTTDLSSELDVLVKVTGAADTVTDRNLDTVSNIDVDSASHNYNAVVTEDTNSVNILNLFANDNTALALTDTDGSETLFIKITDVPTGFNVSGAGVVQIGDNWLIDRDNFDDVVLNIPENYSGEVEFNLSLQTVEDDGSKLTPIEIPLSILVMPKAESSIQTTDSQIEDTTINELDFTFNQADNNETLESIFINTETIPTGVTLVRTVDGSRVELTTTAVGTAQWLELTLTDGVVETVTAELDSSWHDVSGSYDFDIKYMLKDTADDSESNTYDNSVEKEATYTVTVNAVTDTATSSISGISTTQASDATITGTGTDIDKYTVSIKDNTTISLPFVLTPDDMTSENNGADDDGSETVLTNVTITGVPEGVGVVGGVYQGDTIDSNGDIVNSGEWTLSLDSSADLTLDNDGTTNNIKFTVDGENVTFNEFTGANDDDTATITISVKHQDGSSTILTNSESFQLKLANDADLGEIADADVTVDNVSGEAMDLTISSTVPTYHMTEDEGIALSDMVILTDGTVSNDTSKFSIIITDLPDGLNISGMSYDSNLGGYVLSDTISLLDDTTPDSDGRLNGEGALADIQAALTSITITPDSNNNVNNYPDTDFDFTVEVLTYNSESQMPNSVSTAVNFDIKPISDATTITINGVDVDESSSPTAQTITLDLSNSADAYNSNSLIIKDNQVYVKFTETYTDDVGGLNEGSIKYYDTTSSSYVDVSSLTTTTIGEDTYYVIPNISNLNTDITFEYTPHADNYGTLVIDSSVTTQEYPDGKTNSDGVAYTTDEVISTASKTITINPSIDIPDETSTTPYLTVSATGNEGDVSMLGVTTSSTDDSESFTSAKLASIPYGYEVYYAGVLQTGVISGVDGNGNYLYDYSFTFNNGTVSDLNNIGIQAPDEDYAGVLNDVKLSVTITEGSISETIEKDINFEFIAVADDLITFNPTNALGDEYVDENSEWTQINLNVNVQDTDSSETITVTFDGLPESSSFSFDESSAYANVSYSGGIYTLTDIPYDAINSLYVQTPTGYKGGTIQTTAWTVESSNNDTSAVKTGSFNIELESKASGVTPFTSTIGNEINTTLSGQNIISSGYSISLNVADLDLLDKDGSESLYLKISGLADSFDVDVSTIAGVNAQKVGTDWIIDIGSATDSTYDATLTALEAGNMKLVSTTTDGSINTLSVSAYSQLETNQNVTSDEIEVANIAFNTTVDTDGTMNATANDDNIIGTDSSDIIIAGGGVDIVMSGDGDDTITTDGSATIDGEAGFDTIKLESGINLTQSIDFTKLDNIEKIDLSANGNHSLSGLTLDDVLDMTDDNNDLIITGETGDSVALTTTGWTPTNTTDDGSKTTYEYSKDGSSDSIKLTIDDQIDTTGM